MSSDEETFQDESEIVEIQGDERPNTDFMETEFEEVTATETNEATHTIEAIDGNETAETNDEENRKIVKPKKARNPQPKLNEQRLLGQKKGLYTLESYFERVKFKGKGHEESDLNILMKTYEYWCHRLFPKYPFDACIARLETLGTKKAVITNIKKIRIGVANDDDKPLESDEELSEIPTQNNGFVNEVNDQFDQLLSKDPLAENTTVPTLTEEQLEKIRQNKERAEKIRKEKLLKIRKMSTNLLPSNSQQSKHIFKDLSGENTQDFNDMNNQEFGVHETNANITNIQLKNNISEMRNESENIESEIQSIPHNFVDEDEIQNTENSEENVTHFFTEDNHKRNNPDDKVQNNREDSFENNTISDENNEVALDQILDIINVNNK